MKVLGRILIHDSLVDTIKRVAKMYVNEIWGLDYEAFQKVYSSRQQNEV